MDDQQPPLIWKLKKQTITMDQPLIMGIINCTPDSFSDGGQYNHLDKAYQRAVEMDQDGADIIDIGGESTRPGADEVSEAEELDRVIPLIEKCKASLNTLLSIDTTKAGVAEAALQAGADIINDISAGRDENMFHIAQQQQAAMVLMHMRATPQTMNEHTSYDNIFDDINDYFQQRLAQAQQSGLSREQIVLDPGIGFAKTVEQNFQLMANLQKFEKHERPLLIGASRKSFIGKSLNIEIADRLAGSLSAAAVCSFQGAQIFRVHDVKESVQAVKIAWKLSEQRED